MLPPDKCRQPIKLQRFVINFYEAIVNSGFLSHFCKLNRCPEFDFIENFANSRIDEAIPPPAGGGHEVGELASGNRPHQQPVAQLIQLVEQQFGLIDGRFSVVLRFFAQFLRGKQAGNRFHLAGAGRARRACSVRKFRREAAFLNIARLVAPAKAWRIYRSGSCNFHQDTLPVIETGDSLNQQGELLLNGP
jgi:hypothetical protein